MSLDKMSSNRSIYERPKRCLSRMGVSPPQVILGPREKYLQEYPREKEDSVIESSSYLELSSKASWHNTLDLSPQLHKKILASPSGVAPGSWESGYAPSHDRRPSPYELQA